MAIPAMGPPPSAGEEGADVGEGVVEGVFVTVWVTPAGVEILPVGVADAVAEDEPVDLTAAPCGPRST